MNLIRGLVLTKEVYSTLEGFDGKLGKEKANSKKLSEDLKVMSLEKAQLESKKWRLGIKRELLRLSKSASRKPKNWPRKGPLLAKIAAATVNSTLEAVVVEKDSLLAEVKEEIERIKADHVDAYARAGTAYQDGFEGTPEYKDLAHHFMPAKGK
ncbi:hypothetical protein Adt_21621 [Abeliophyllum distichum]|uniref:Uncharacterized protein n=1 Tax=Abeliophyllum distichum TaxID=126358 RepID=A0ABD1T010_9LAMI